MLAARTESADSYGAKDDATGADGATMFQRAVMANTAAAVTGTPYGTARTPLTAHAAQAIGQTHGAGGVYESCEASDVA